jgi:hypothetical protein
MHEVVHAEVGTVNDFDIAIFNLHTHAAFPDGFRKLAVADYADLHEMMEVDTCGYPFGGFLWNQVGSVTSSFTKGTMSAFRHKGLAANICQDSSSTYCRRPAIAAALYSARRQARYLAFYKAVRSIRRGIQFSD